MTPKKQHALGSTHGKAVAGRDGMRMQAPAMAHVISLGGMGAINSPYQGAGFDKQDTVNYWPSRLSADAQILGAKDMSLARILDIFRNDPTARAGLDRLVDLIVGPGLLLCAEPDGVALGIRKYKKLRKLAREMQAEWRLFANDPRKTNDAQRKLTMNGQWRLLARTMLTNGEVTAPLCWRDPPANVNQRYSTCVMTVDPERMSNPDGMADTLTLRGGVEMDPIFGEPLAYWVRNAHPGDYWAAEQAYTWTRVPRATSWGRPVFIHGFEPERNGVTRGISPFVSLISRLRMLGKGADHELASAAANALYAAFVETDLPAEEVAQRLTAGGGKTTTYADRVLKHFTDHPAQVGGVRIPVMPPGSKISMNTTPRQSSTFGAFQTVFLRSIAAAMGLSYEQLTMDWSQTNYSSARAALNEVWRAIKRMSAIFVEQVVTPIYYAVMEEAFAKGYIKLPEGAAPLGVPEAANDHDSLAVFQAMPGAFLRARWIGPPRGYVDPVKEAQGSALRMQNLTSTLKYENADAGYDYEETLDQIAIENEELAERGIVRTTIAPLPTVDEPVPNEDVRPEQAGLQQAA